NTSAFVSELPDQLLVSDTGNNRIVSTSALVAFEKNTPLPPINLVATGLNHPTGLSADPSGEVVAVSETGANRVGLLQWSPPADVAKSIQVIASFDGWSYEPAVVDGLVRGDDPANFDPRGLGSL